MHRSSLVPSDDDTLRGKGVKRRWVSFSPPPLSPSTEEGERSYRTFTLNSPSLDGTVCPLSAWCTHRVGGRGRVPKQGIICQGWWVSSRNAPFVLQTKVRGVSLRLPTEVVRSCLATPRTPRIFQSTECFLDTSLLWSVMTVSLQVYMESTSRPRRGRPSGRPVICLSKVHELSEK